MKKLLNIPDDLFKRIKGNASKFGWSVQSEVIEMLYFSVCKRTDFVNNRRSVPGSDYIDWTSDIKSAMKVTRDLVSKKK